MCIICITVCALIVIGCIIVCNMHIGSFELPLRQLTGVVPGGLRGTNQTTTPMQGGYFRGPSNRLKSLAAEEQPLGLPHFWRPRQGDL